MGLKEFRIELDHPARSYFAGQPLAGKLVLELRQRKEIEGLEIVCCGHGRVQWKETSPGKKKVGDGQQAQAVISTEETYADSRILLLETKDCEPIGLEGGLHEYPFEFCLPASGPSSFQGPYGHTKYYLSATLRRPRPKGPHTVSLPFSVNGVLDLNKEALSPAGGDLRKFTKKGAGLLPCLLGLKTKGKGGGVGFHLSLLRTAFVPGEYIQFVAELRNCSPVEVSGVTLALIQETSYCVGDRRKSGFKQTICTAKGPSVSAGETEIWETNPIDSLFLQIPSVPPTNLGTSKIIGVKYFLQLEMEFYGQKNIKGQLPILIGTVPVRTAFKDFITVTKKSAEIIPYSKKESFGTALGYPELCCPVYEEAACFTPTIDFSSHVRAKDQSGQNGLIKARSKVDPEENGPEVDSDEEFVAGTGIPDYNDLFVPVYAKYVTAYGYDD